MWDTIAEYVATGQLPPDVPNQRRYRRWFATVAGVVSPVLFIGIVALLVVLAVVVYQWPDSDSWKVLALLGYLAVVRLVITRL